MYVEQLTKEHAVQVRLIALEAALRFAAMRSLTVDYDDACRIVDLPPGAHHLNYLLDRLMDQNYGDNKLPLSVLVVSGRTGVPGSGFDKHYEKLYGHGMPKGKDARKITLEDLSQKVCRQLQNL